MHLYQAIILAIIQGITEFLPVSSTAHLILFPWLAGWPDPGLAFDVALHTGTLIAVVLYFLRDWLQLLAAGIGLHYPRHASYEYVEHRRKMFWYIVAATIPGAVVGFLFQHKIEDRQGESWYILAIAAALIVVGLVMWYGEYAGRLDRAMERVSFVDAMAIGVAQAFALFPGVSRSGATITAGLFRGLTREAAARFSFLLSTPIIAGADENAPRGNIADPFLDDCHQHRGIGGGGHDRDRVFPALSASTHAKNIHLLPHSARYSDSVTILPHGSRALAPTRPRAMLRPSPTAQEKLCAYSL